MAVAEIGQLETVVDAAKLLRVSRSKVYGLMDSGELEYVKLGKCRRIPRAAIASLIQRGLVQRSA